MLLYCYYLSLAYSNFTTSQCLICKPIVPWATKLMQSVIYRFYSCSPYTSPCGSNISSVVFCVLSTPTLSTSSSTLSPLFQLFYRNNFSWLPNFHRTSLSPPSSSSVPSLLYSCRSLAGMSLTISHFWRQWMRADEDCALFSLSFLLDVLWFACKTYVATKMQILVSLKQKAVIS